jgi:hypothetical protein
LRLEASYLVGLLLAAEFGFDFDDGAEHDHAVAETELGMGYRPIGIGHDELFFNPKIRHSHSIAFGASR